MSLLDRVRDLLVRPPTGDAWDDEGVEDVAALMTAAVATAHADDDGRGPEASRAAMLGAFASASERWADARQGTAGRAAPLSGAAPGNRRGGRRPAFVLVAACALLAASLGTVAASTPGGPLYDARVAAEELGLPQGPVDRAGAQVARLDARVREALDAADRDDAGGVTAALQAYARIANVAAATPVADPQAAAPLAIRVRAQLEVIAGIGTGDRGVDALREQGRVAARAFLAALGEPGDGSGHDPGPGPGAPTQPPPETPASPRDSMPGSSPGRTQDSAGSPGPKPSAAPGGQGGAPSPGATRTPRADGNPSATPQGSGPGSGSGSPGGGPEGETPRPSGGSGGGSDDGSGGGSDAAVGGGSGSPVRS